jgi:Eukaryotic aspartyl protease
MPSHGSLLAFETSLKQFICIFTAFLILTCAADPAPLGVPVGTDFYGYDGLWSGVNIRVGGPSAQAQWVTVFPFTGSQETWVIGPGGCDGTYTCEQARGGLFVKNQSDTWKEEGYFELGFDDNLGDTGYADYGLDQIALNDQLSVAGQVIGIINTTEFWLGALGLGVQQTRFGGASNYLTFLSSLVENVSQIPSHSYGYTAGAYYQLKTVPSSLTLGGVDTNRFVPNHASFTLNPDQLPVVSVNEISVSCEPLESAEEYPDWLKSNPLALLDSSQAAYATIDSSTPFLWLPEAVCDNFATALNLTYNETLDLYFFQEGGTTPDLLRQWNMTFTFSISDYPGSDNNADLAISYNAFNLELTYPFPNLDANFTSPGVPYFPLRKAANDTQYTIGRAFLQETYLTVDYERNNFSVSQATFSLDALTNTNLVAITRPAHSNYTGPFEPFSGLSTGVKAGIGAGAAVGVVSTMAIFLYFCVYGKRSSNSISSEKGSGNRRSLLSRLGAASSRASSDQGASELLGDKRQPTEVSADSSNSRFELPGSTPIEMPAAEVPPQFYSMSRDAVPTGSSKNDRRNPAELEPTHSIEKHGLHFEREASPTPPAYSAAQVGRGEEQRLSNSISPNTPRNSHGFGTMSSGEPGISPVDRRAISSNSSHNSKLALSPVSPNETRFPHLHTGQTESSNGGSDGSFLAPNTRELPSRSASRGSRFVEEGLESEQSESGSSATRPAARFSWEQ